MVGFGGTKCWQHTVVDSTSKKLGLQLMEGQQSKRHPQHRQHPQKRLRQKKKAVVVVVVAAAAAAVAEVSKEGKRRHQK